jgi:hypothetical protein
MQIFYWDIIRNAMTFGGDLIVVLTVISAVIILIGSLIGLAKDNGTAPYWSKRWDAFIIGWIAGVIGLISKFNDPSGLPTGVIFQFNNITVCILLGIAFVFAVAALFLPRLRYRS